MIRTNSGADFLRQASLQSLITALAIIISLQPSSFANRSSKVAVDHIEEVVAVA